MFAHRHNSTSGTILLCALFLFLLIPAGTAEDPDTLRWRIHDVSTRHLRVQRTIREKEIILTNLDLQSVRLREAYLQVQGLDEDVKTHLRNNLTKSTIQLANDTFSTISLPFLALEESVVLISAHIIKEIILNELEEDFSGTYRANLDQVSLESAALGPELAAVRRLMNLSLEEIRAESSDGQQLGDTGLIYRKYRVVIDALEEAISAIPKIRASIEDIKTKHNTEIVFLQSRRDSLQVELDGLNERLAIALSEAQTTQEELNGNQIANAVVPTGPIDPPDVSAQKEDETNLEQYLKHYNAALPLIDGDYPRVLGGLSNLWTELETDLTTLEQELATSQILNGSSIHAELQVLLDIESRDRHSLQMTWNPISESQDLFDDMSEAKPLAQAAKLRVTAALTECRDFFPKIAELRSLQGEREELGGFMATVGSRWFELMPPGQTTPSEYSIYQYAAQLTPVTTNFGHHPPTVGSGLMPKSSARSCLRSKLETPMRCVINATSGLIWSGSEPIPAGNTWPPGVGFSTCGRSSGLFSFTLATTPIDSTFLPPAPKLIPHSPCCLRSSPPSLRPDLMTSPSTLAPLRIGQGFPPFPSRRVLKWPSNSRSSGVM